VIELTERWRIKDPEECGSNCCRDVSVRPKRHATSIVDEKVRVHQESVCIMLVNVGRIGVLNQTYLIKSDFVVVISTTDARYNAVIHTA
jgi:hypothetical protein